MRDAHPSMGAAYKSLLTKINVAYKKPRIEKSTPTTEIARIGKYEKETKVSMNSLIYHFSVEEEQIHTGLRHVSQCESSDHAIINIGK